MIAYFDLPSGLSGDMCLGCLVDAGWPVDRLNDMVRALGINGDDCRIQAEAVTKGPLAACQVTVKTTEQHHHRRLRDIEQLIDTADLPSQVKQRAVAVFARLAQAEAKVHGTTIAEIHFHEVGALDAIVDIVGTVLGLHELNVDAVYASPPPLGEGWVDSAHGRIPLPAPATLELLAAAGAPTRPAPGPGEWVTPTGAALLAELAQFEQPAMTLHRIGTGAGQRDCDWPNVARLWLGQPVADGPMVQIETNIDDMNPQHYAAVSDRLFQAGARDVWLTPVHMKKGRPGVVLSVLAPGGLEHTLADLILHETTTLGVRVTPVRRHEAGRELRQVDTPFGAIAVKIKTVNGRVVGAAPEYDDCIAAATNGTHGASVRDVYDAAMRAAHELIEQSNAQTRPE